MVIIRSSTPYFTPSTATRSTHNSNLMDMDHHRLLYFHHFTDTRLPKATLPQGTHKALRTMTISRVNPLQEQEIILKPLPLQAIRPQRTFPHPSRSRLRRKLPLLPHRTRTMALPQLQHLTNRPLPPTHRLQRSTRERSNSPCGYTVHKNPVVDSTIVKFTNLLHMTEI